MSVVPMRDDVLVSTLIRQPVVNEAGEKIGDDSLAQRDVNRAMPAQR